MAGVEFEKYLNGAFGEMSCHFDNTLRADERVHHSNQTINSELTPLNYYVGASSYQEICRNTENIISEADEKKPPKRVRADRKVSFSLEIPCPPELEGTDQEDIFYQKVYEMYKSYLPGTTGAVVHKDEKHEYYDSKKEEMCVSLNHMHLMGACLTEDGRINCHDLIDTKMCQKVNDDIQKLCLQEWGISYQTGEGRRGAKRTVEQCKAESEVALQAKLAKENLTVVSEMRQEKKTLANEIEDLEIIKGINERQIYDLDKQVEEKNILVKKLTEKVENKSAELANLENEASRKTRLVDKLNDALANLFTRFNKAYIQMQKIFDHWSKNDLKIYTEIVEKTDPSIEKGKKAIDVMMMHNQNIIFGKSRVTPQMENEVDIAKEDLKNATETLENLEDEYDYER